MEIDCPYTHCTLSIADGLRQGLTPRRRGIAHTAPADNLTYVD